MSSQSVAQGTSPAGRRLMVVDDAECIRVTVRELFKHENVEVVTAKGADDCMRHLRNGFKGVILMDVMMPGKSGWDTIREIEAAGFSEGNIIVMLTGMDTPDQRMDGLQELVVDYVTKPFSAEKLIETVLRYFEYLELARVEPPVCPEKI